MVTQVGGAVTARSVKLLNKIEEPDEPETRDAWWFEIREEIRAHAKCALGPLITFCPVQNDAWHGICCPYLAPGPSSACRGSDVCGDIIWVCPRAQTQTWNVHANCLLQGVGMSRSDRVPGKHDHLQRAVCALRHRHGRPPGPHRHRALRPRCGMCMCVRVGFINLSGYLRSCLLRPCSGVCLCVRMLFIFYLAVSDLSFTMLITIPLGHYVLGYSVARRHARPYCQLLALTLHPRSLPSCDPFRWSERPARLCAWLNNEPNPPIALPSTDIGHQRRSGVCGRAHVTSRRPRHFRQDAGLGHRIGNVGPAEKSAETVCVCTHPLQVCAVLHASFALVRFCCVLFGLAAHSFSEPCMDVLHSHTRTLCPSPSPVLCLTCSALFLRAGHGFLI